MEDGTDPFELYSNNGADANANTSNYKTTYLFSGPQYFKENLNYLLDYVQKPYFTDKNVEKEKGIIIQELNMYKDNPYNRMYEGILYNSFKNHPIRYPIGGTVDSVKSITKEDLYTCYNTFYNPSNMILVITGNVDPVETFSVVESNQDKKKFNKFKSIKTKSYNEPNTVFKKQEKINMDIEIPKVGIGYKIDVSSIKENINDIKVLLSTMLEIKLGNTSLLREKLVKENLITNNIDFSLVNTDKHILVIIMVDTKEQDTVLEMINEELKDIKITEEELNRRRKVLKSNCIYRSDNIYSLNSKIVNNIFNYDKVILDEYEMIDKINMKNMKKLISHISFDNKTVYYINKS
jgi:predicted Zn-dependent peptidase